jgi:hypothetical protein
LLAEYYKQACLQLNLRQAAKTVWELESSDEETLRLTLMKQRRQHPEVTALFLRNVEAALATRFFDVPKAISLATLFPSLTPCRVQLTGFDLWKPDSTLAQWALMDLLTQIRERESGRPNPPNRRAYYEPELVVGGSTRALKAMEKTAPMPDRNGLPNSSSSYPWETWRKMYPYLKKDQNQDWRQFNLTKLANHSLTREHGWLGEEPLLHLAPGLRSIHGVPFNVIDEKANAGQAVVTFRSPHTHSAARRQLPTQAQITVNERLKALYFLHGCAYAATTSFAEYQLHFKTGAVIKVPLTPLGNSPSLLRKLRGKCRPNLQDWWPDRPQQDFPHAMEVTVYNPSAPEEYKRHLYTLEWINPRREEEVRCIEIHVNPEAGPVLGLLAVTALL